MMFEPDEKIVKIIRKANNAAKYKKWCEDKGEDVSTFGNLKSKYGEYVKKIAENLRIKGDKK